MGLCAPHRDLTSSNSISKYGELGSRRFQSILACRDVSKKFLFLTFTDSVIVSSLGSHAPRSSQNNYRMAEHTNVPRMSSLQWQWKWQYVHLLVLLLLFSFLAARALESPTWPVSALHTLISYDHDEPISKLSVCLSVYMIVILLLCLCVYLYDISYS